LLGCRFCGFLPLLPVCACLTVFEGPFSFVRGFLLIVLRLHACWLLSCHSCHELGMSFLLVFYLAYEEKLLCCLHCAWVTLGSVIVDDINEWMELMSWEIKNDDFGEFDVN